LTKTIEEYLLDLNHEIMQQWRDMISKINRKLATSYSITEPDRADEIFGELENLYHNSVALSNDEFVIDAENADKGDEYITHVIVVRCFAEDGDLAYEEEIQSDQATAWFNYQNEITGIRGKISETYSLIEDSSDNHYDFVTRIYGKADNLMAKIMFREVTPRDFE
jgi:hypothetical protein